MSAGPRQALHDLVAEVPRHVVPPDLADRARAVGVRRRRRARITRAGLVVLLVAAGGFVLSPYVAGEVRMLRSAETGAQGYPERVETRLHWRGQPPARPGPIAGVVEGRNSADMRAVSPYGDTWQLPGVTFRERLAFAVSADGSRLAYFDPGRDGGSPYVLHDLITGEQEAFHGVAGPGWDEVAYWSPDGARVLVSPPPADRDASGNGAAGGAAVGEQRAQVLGVDGTRSTTRWYGRCRCGRGSPGS